MFLYLRFVLYIIIYPFWRYAPARWLCRAEVSSYCVGECCFIGSYPYLEICKKSLELLQSVDSNLFSNLRLRNIAILEADIMPKDFFCKRFGINTQTVNEGPESVFAEIIRVYFLTKYNNYKIREFYYEDEAPSVWKQAAWLEGIKRDNLEH